VVFGCLAVLLAASFAGSVQAEELLPVHARTIVLGRVSGVAYYTNDTEGSHFVATLGGGESGAPVRVMATLAAGQSMTLSVPRDIDKPAIEVTFSRQGSRVFVNESTALTEAAQ
jgi:predicted aconitase